MAERNTDNERPDLLRLERCPDCGYLLTGLPEQGICPECGFGYSTEMIVLYGPLASQMAETVPGRAAWLRRRLASPWMVPVWVGLGIGSQYIPRMLPRWANIGMFVGLFFLVLLLYRRWRARREELAAPWQLRLCPMGFAQREFLGPAPLHPWGPDVEAEVKIDRHRPRSLRRLPPDKRWVTVQITRKRHGRLASQVLAYLALECDAAAAEQLRERVQGWTARGSVDAGTAPSEHDD